MGFLANLLPGLRDLRTPLTAGYVWLIGLYVLLEPMAQVRAVASQVNVMFGPVSHAVGAVGLFGLVSVAAYLLGSLTLVNPTRSLRRPPPGQLTLTILRVRRWRKVSTDADLLLCLRAEEIRKFSDFYRKANPAVDVASKGLSAAQQMRADVEHFDPQAAAVRLHIANSSLWDQYDRLAAEAELRATLVWPFVLLALASSVRLRPGWIVGVVFMAIAIWVYVVSDARVCDANGVLAQCLFTGVYQDPSLVPDADEERRQVEELRRHVDELNKKLERYASSARIVAPPTVPGPVSIRDETDSHRGVPYGALRPPPEGAVARLVHAYGAGGEIHTVTEFAPPLFGEPQYLSPRDSSAGKVGQPGSPNPASSLPEERPRDGEDGSSAKPGRSEG